MAETGNEVPAGNQQGDPQGVGERMGSLETQLSELMTLVVGQQQMLASVVETTQRERVESSGSLGVAPGNTEPEAGAHHLGATGRTAGGTGDDAQGLGVSGVRVGSRGVADPGLNPHVSDVNRSSVSAVNFGPINGTVGGALGSQSSVPPTATPASEWWGNVASGNNAGFRNLRCFGQNVL